MNRALILFCLICAAFEIGCVSTRVTSLVDPGYRDSSYGRILVVGNYERLELTKLSEQYIVENLRDSGIFAMGNSDLLPPLRKYSDSEVAAVYTKYKFDAVLVLSLIDFEKEDFYMPGWMMVDSRANVHRGMHHGMMGSAATLSTSISSTPGNYTRQSYTDTKAELKTVSTGVLVCRMEASSEQATDPTTFGQAGYNAESLMKSICRKMVAELKKNHLVQTK